MVGKIAIKKKPSFLRRLFVLLLSRDFLQIHLLDKFKKSSDFAVNQVQKKLYFTFREGAFASLQKSLIPSIRETRIFC
ncbi:MAG: hypothetical protein CFE23_15030 [Flavobacterium sp. BFFFF1]|nr:MAG: hypothetical protein CFE23_15030 [Flavobacterium sp. BFFFF1]